MGHLNETASGAATPVLLVVCRFIALAILAWVIPCTTKIICKLTAVLLHQALWIRIALKSLTLVNVGPVMTCVPSDLKQLCASLFFSASRASIPSARAAVRVYFSIIHAYRWRAESKLLIFYDKMVPRGGFEPPTQGFSMKMVVYYYLITVGYMVNFLVCVKVCFLHFEHFRSDTVSPTHKKNTVF